MIDGAEHLEFYGADTYFKDDRVMNYLVSVPWDKVKANEVLLAWEMNGDASVHFPLRSHVDAVIAETVAFSQGVLAKFPLLGKATPTSRSTSDTHFTPRAYLWLVFHMYICHSRRPLANANKTPVLL